MEIEISGHKFKVKFVDGDSPEMEDGEDICHLGLTDFINETICIRKGLSPKATRETVVHELVHAFIFSFGYHVDSEESMCDFFGSQGDSIFELTERIMKGIG